MNKHKKHKGKPKVEPSRRNQNKWYFQDLQTPICEQVWKIGQQYYNLMQDPQARPRHRIKNPAALVKLLYWIFLTGSRQQEAFLEPYPRLTIVNKDNETRAIIWHVNEKHKKAGKRDEVQAMIPIFDEWEQKMWNFVTSGGTEFEASQIFQYDSWKSSANNNITAIFKANFKTTLIDPETRKSYKNMGISPHQLRHMRSYNVLINHEMYKNRELVKLWFGWSSDLMISYYAHVRDIMGLMDQEKMLKSSGMLTNFKIDANKVFISPMKP